MTITLNDGFLGMLTVLLVALSISNFVEYDNKQDPSQGRMFFAVIFMLIALGLGGYKIATR